jgi:pyruvate formate lyase activating enzyme
VRIGALQKISTIDYPRRLSCVIGTQGCNLQCVWCHNAFLIPSRCSGGCKNWPAEEVLAFLRHRQGLLDGVVLSGGEPTLQPDLAQFCQQIKRLDYPIKLDTNGTRPGVIRRLLDQGLVDYIAMDVKAGHDQYASLSAKRAALSSAVQESIDLILSRCPAYEFRTTCVKPFVNTVSMPAIAWMVKGARVYYLQKCRLPSTLPDHHVISPQPCTDAELGELLTIASRFVEHCEIREC